MEPRLASSAGVTDVAATTGRWCWGGTRVFTDASAALWSQSPRPGRVFCYVRKVSLLTGEMTPETPLHRCSTPAVFALS